MPFKSEKQRRWMWANEPELARKWADKEKSEIEKEVREEWDGGDNLVNPVNHAEIASGHKAHQGLEILKITESRLRKIIQEELTQDADCEDILSLYDKLEDEERIGKYTYLSDLYDGIVGEEEEIKRSLRTGIHHKTGLPLSQRDIDQIKSNIAHDTPELLSWLGGELAPLEDEEESILMDIQDIEDMHGMSIEDLIQYCEDDDEEDWEEWDGISDEDFVAGEPDCPITSAGGGENYKLCEPHDGLTCWYTSVGAEDAWCDAWKDAETGARVDSQPPGPRWRKVRI